MRLLNRSAGRLSRHRRGRFAGVAVLLLGLILTGTAYSAFAPAQAEESTSDTAQIAEGRELFLVSCSFCHGKNGEGIQTQRDGQQLGPSLVGVGAAAAHFQLETGRMPLVQPGVQGAAKPPAFDQEEIDALGAYIASLGPGPGVPSESSYSTENLSDAEKQESIRRGGQLFLSNCTACHNFTGAGGAMPQGKEAPPILNAEPVHIYEAMLTGPSQMPVFDNDNLTPDNKRDIIAYIEFLQNEPNPGGFGMGSLGPVSDGVFVWVVGIGGLVGFAIWIAAHTTRSKRRPEAVEEA